MAEDSTKTHAANKSVDTRNGRVDTRPKKPYAGFPLNFHPTGRFSKKIRGQVHYFGRWGSKRGEKIVPVENLDEVCTAAVDLYDLQRDDLQAGRKPRKQGGGFIIKDLVNDYLNAKRQLLATGELAPRTFSEYHHACEQVSSKFGLNRLVSDLHADDFAELRATLAETRGPVTLGNDIQRIRMIFKWAFDQGKIDVPIRYGQSFNKPKAKAVRQSRADNGPKMFERDELKSILDSLKANPQLRAIVLLAVNAGYGQGDVSQLPFDALDLKGGWVTFPRPKTAIDRRAKLWPETVAAIREALEVRPQPLNPEHNNLVFLHRKGKPFVRESTSDDPAKWQSRTDLIGKAFSDLLKTLGINGRRGFYALRHTFQTIAEDSRDLPAVKFVMGHVDDSMSGVYRERISDERLEAVAATVHDWLFPPKKRKGRKGGAK